MYIKRALESQIEKFLFKGKILIIYGARQVGKTTLVNALLEKHDSSAGYYNCDLPEVRQVLESQNPILIKNYVGAKKLAVFDEAQQVREISRSLKILHDTFPQIQVISTGSSSFDLANKLSEPLTGRSLTFTLYPFSLGELEAKFNRFELMSQLETFLSYGLYPGVVTADLAGRELFLRNLAGNYLYKDVLMFENLRRSDLLLDLLKLLALQVGAEVSVNELSVKLKCNVKTVERYLDLLEKSFVIFRLRPFSRNLRNEIGKKIKVFFCDLGVRNALIERFAPLSVRDDVGALWENFCVLERIKFNQKKAVYCNIYFWRNHAGREVDYLEERDEKINAFEFKWSGAKYRAPEDFMKAYGVSEVKVINRDNLLEFIF